MNLAVKKVDLISTALPLGLYENAGMLWAIYTFSQGSTPAMLSLGPIGNFPKAEEQSGGIGGALLLRAIAVAARPELAKELTGVGQ